MTLCARKKEDHFLRVQEMVRVSKERDAFYAFFMH